MKRIVLLVGWISAFLFFAGCGAKGQDPQFSLNAQNAYCPAGLDKSKTLPDVLQVQKYRITVSGADLSPMQFEAPGNASGMALDNIPKGDNRTVLVEAINNRSQVICRRELQGVSIQGGTSIPIAFSLLAVPFIANLSDGNLITQTRLVFQGYGEPAGAVEITDEFGGSETVLTDLNTNEELVSPSVQDASFGFKPAILSLGEHTFHVRDIQTGQESQVKVTLVSPGRPPGMAINVTGAITVTRSQSVGMGGSFSQVLEALEK